MYSGMLARSGPVSTLGRSQDLQDLHGVQMKIAEKYSSMFKMVPYSDMRYEVNGQVIENCNYDFELEKKVIQNYKKP